MTSTDDGRILYSTPTHLPGPTRRVFDCETTPRSEEDEDHQLDAVSTESPISKNSCSTPIALDRDTHPAETPQKPRSPLDGYEENSSVDALPTVVTRKDSQYSTLTSTTEISSVQDEVTPKKAANVTSPIEESDDDFGEFEEAEPTAAPDPPSAVQDDDFGDFQEVSATPQIASTSEPHLVSPLRGLNYTTHIKTLFQSISSAPSPQTGGWLAVRGTKLYASPESRLGLQLLYPRSLPPGFLRSSGLPLVLSSQILTTEQRLLTRLGLQELYSTAQKRETLAQPIAHSGADRRPSADETRSKYSTPETHTSVDDLSFDLDFLVQFSNQQPSGSRGSSKSAVESLPVEELARSSTLHELFDGILDSSQSSFVSRSSSPLNSRNEIPQPPAPVTDPPAAAQPPSLSEDDWDVFMNAEPVVGISDQPERRQLVEDWTEFAEVVAEVRDPEEGEEADIFAGEWLNQLRSSHESQPPEMKPVCSPVKASVQEASDVEWGMFTEAPSRSNSVRVCCGETQMPVAEEMSQLVQSHGSATGMLHPTAAAQSRQWEMDLGVLDGFPMEAALSTRMQQQDEMLAMNAVLSDQPIQDASFELEEDEWGGFQG